MPLLRAQSISKAYPGVQALADVSFELEAGEIHALVGENGAGKSTLIKIITGAVQPDGGRLEVDGQVVGEHDPQTARALGIAAIYQQPALFNTLTVAENLAIGLERGGLWRRVDWAGRRRRAGELLARVGAEIDPDRPVSGLSMPEQQWVEIARALGAQAKVLILDEPTACLPEQEIGQLFDVLRSLKAEGVGIIYISHRLDELFTLADRVTVLRDGATVATSPLAEIDKAALIRLMVGRELSALYPERTPQLGEVRLEAQQLGCAEAGLADISFQLRAGEILGLAGLVGSGRSELARTLFGLTPADDGRIEISGQTVHIDSPQTAIRLGLAYVPEDRRRHGMIGPMSCVHNITLAVLDRLAHHGLLPALEEESLAVDLARRLDVRTPSVYTPTGNLSGGNQQKVALARWLAAAPAIFIVDEPTQGVDVGAKAEIHRILADLAAAGKAVLLISSELPEVLGLSDRVGVMRNGRLVAVLDKAEATQEHILTLALGHVEEAPA